jgi:hypothetical protein
MEQIINNNDNLNYQLNFLEVLSQTYDFDNNGLIEYEGAIVFPPIRLIQPIQPIQQIGRIYRNPLIQPGRINEIISIQQTETDGNFPTPENQRIYRNSQQFEKIILQNFSDNNDNDCLEIEKKNILCSICLCDFVFDNKDTKHNNICQISCEHYFHKKCISKWLDKKKNCPLCRKDCLEYDIEKNEFKKNIYPEKCKFNKKYHNIYDRIEGRQLLEFLFTTNIFYENIQIPRFGLVSNLKITWHNENPCAFVVDPTNTNDNNLTNPIIEIDVRDILLVMEQAHCNASLAIQTLIHYNLDIINAIMVLTI